MLADTSGRLSVSCSVNRADRSTLSGSRRGSAALWRQQEVVERAAANEVEESIVIESSAAAFANFAEARRRLQTRRKC